MSSVTPRPIWAVIPAAGSGSRMQSAIPKQYLSLAGQSVLTRSVQSLLAWPQLAGLVVVLNPADAQREQQEKELCLLSTKVHVVDGGAQRADSVELGLQYIDALSAATPAIQDAWVLVHDAARPFLTTELIDKLVTAVFSANSDGGILALVATDTVKQAGPAHVNTPPQKEIKEVLHTLNRENIYLAQTPQLFPCQTLLQALQHAKKNSLAVTDEASAMELAGKRVLLVEGEKNNFKITTPFDFQLAVFMCESANHVVKNNNKKR